MHESTTFSTQLVGHVPLLTELKTFRPLDEVKNIREFTFRLEGDTPELRKAVEGGLNQLRTEFPDFRFNAQFGGK